MRMHCVLFATCVVWEISIGLSRRGRSSLSRDIFFLSNHQDFIDLSGYIACVQNSAEHGNI